MRAYLAAGWFTPEQERSRSVLFHSLRLCEINFYSPKEDGLFTKEITIPQTVFEKNISEIRNSDFILVSTEGKDMGTLFECGCAYTMGKPIVYYWPKKEPLNLMLSQSAFAVIPCVNELIKFLSIIQKQGLSMFSLKQPWKGEIE
jgi:nucleoside 2-deoxyribosyltransferase